ncbi:hypothetical protein Q8A73_005290 [Channa argus]|nr:hypothetical protein Q8A73_005290 [Channa argus]
MFFHIKEDALEELRDECLHSPHSARPGQEHSWPDLVEPVDRRMERSPPRARFLRKHAQSASAKRGKLRVVLHSHRVEVKAQLTSYVQEYSKDCQLVFPAVSCRGSGAPCSETSHCIRKTT